LSPMLENSLRQSLLLSKGNFGIFFSRPLSAALMSIALLLLILPNIPWVRLHALKKKALDEQE
jgi:putative tricarboxylic transport membrane protein